MRRAARLLVPIGVVLTVIGVGRWHATHRGFYEVSTWTWAYMAVLIVAAYAFGLPDLTRGLRSGAGASIGAAGAAAVSISAGQLVAGSLVLPRFVVFASALVLIPWFVACTVIANAGRKQERLHDQVILVA